MHHKIYISVIIIIASLLSWSAYNFTVSSTELKRESESYSLLIASEKEVPSPNGKSIKACNVRVNDKETNRLITAHRFIFSKNGTCPSLPQDLFITKEEYIKELQNNKGWGIFDDDYVYPDMIPPDIKQTNQSSASSK